MTVNDHAFFKALAAGGGDVVLTQHLEHGRAGHAGDHRRLYQAQRERGEHEVAQAIPRVFVPGHEAARGQPLELDGEQDHQQDAGPEGGHRQAQAW